MRKFRFWLLPLALAVGIGFAKGNTAYATANNQASQTTVPHCSIYEWESNEISKI